MDNGLFLWTGWVAKGILYLHCNPYQNHNISHKIQMTTKDSQRDLKQKKEKVTQTNYLISKYTTGIWLPKQSSVSIRWQWDTVGHLNINPSTHG